MIRSTLGGFSLGGGVVSSCDGERSCSGVAAVAASPVAGSPPPVDAITVEDIELTIKLKTTKIPAAAPHKDRLSFSKLAYSSDR